MSYTLNSYKTLLAISLLISVFSSIARQADSTVAKLINHHWAFPGEKIYLHTDKEIYTQNETLWFSAYMVDASSHLPSDLSLLIYVDLVSPSDSVITSLPIQILQSKGSGSITLADSLGEGTYTIRAYSKYMRNFSR